MGNDNSALDFFLIDNLGNKRIPFMIQAGHGPYGYALHPVGLGNQPKEAYYTTDLKELVEGVVLEGLGVRTKASKGPQKGQSNTLQLGEKTVAGYYLRKSLFDWVKGAEIRPLNESPRPE